MSFKGKERRLRPRERDVVNGLCAGMGPKEIAVEYRLSVGTVRTYIRDIAGEVLPPTYWGINPIQAIILWRLTPKL